jgi:hypothetical protein
LRFLRSRERSSGDERPIGAAKRWLVATIGVLTLLIVQLSVARSADTAYVRSLTSASSLNVLGSDSAATVAVLFRLDDCAASIDALRFWNAATATRAVRVRGLVLDTSEDSASIRDILGGTGIGYPLTSTSDLALGRTLRGLGHFTTPIAVVLDRQRQVRLIAPLSEATSRQKVRDILAYTATLADSVPPQPLTASRPTT